MLRRACGVAGAGALLGVLPRVARCRQRESGPDHPNQVVGTTPEGTPIIQRTLANGTTALKLIDWGATITSIRAADQYGHTGEIALGFDDAAPYVDGRSPYFGCVAGRVANRTAGGRFSLDGKLHELGVNNGPNHLHGGVRGFDKQLWHCESQTPTSVVYALLSHDGDEGYPGTLIARVRYSLETPSELRIEYEATSDAPTPVNLTNHTYFNLRDGGRISDVLGHEIEICADFYLPVDQSSIPTGEVRPLERAPAMDLRVRRRIGERIREADNGAFNPPQPRDPNPVTPPHPHPRDPTPLLTPHPRDPAPVTPLSPLQAWGMTTIT